MQPIHLVRFAQAVRRIGGSCGDLWATRDGQSPGVERQRSGLQFWNSQQKSKSRAVRVAVLEQSTEEQEQEIPGPNVTLRVCSAPPPTHSLYPPLVYRTPRAGAGACTPPQLT